MRRRVSIVEDDRDLREAMSLMVQFTDSYEFVAAFRNLTEMKKLKKIITF